MNYSIVKSSSQTGSYPVLTFVRATLTWLRERIHMGFGTNLYGSLCASRIPSVKHRSSRRRGIFGARAICGMHNGLMIPSHSFTIMNWIFFDNLF
jgi:hypothetical protein